MLEPPRLGALAVSQLAAWEKIAMDWPLYEQGSQARCGDPACDQGIYRTRDDRGTFYVYSPDQTLALIVAHLRQAHMDLDPDR